jgi:hypothetical protein
MISKSLDNPIVTVSVRVYQVLLVAYPTNFQQEYGPHMLQVFRDCCLRTLKLNGANGMVRLWTVTLFDYIQSVVSEHRQKETQMKKEMKPEDIRLAGWALTLGGVAFITCMLLMIMGSPPYSDLPDVLLPFLCLPLLVVGLLAMRSRYGEAVGAFGRNILLAGALLGPLTSVIGMGLAKNARASWSPMAEMGWALTVGGPAVSLACLTLFGVAALYKKPLPRWNILPFLAGLWYPAIFFVWFIAFLNTGEPSNSVAGIPSVIPISLIILQGIALVALGNILKSDVPEEIPAIA